MNEMIHLCEKCFSVCNVSELHANDDRCPKCNFKQTKVKSSNPYIKDAPEVIFEEIDTNSGNSRIITARKSQISNILQEEADEAVLHFIPNTVEESLEFIPVEVAEVAEQQVAEPLIEEEVSDLPISAELALQEPTPEGPVNKISISHAPLTSKRSIVEIPSDKTSRITHLASDLHEAKQEELASPDLTQAQEDDTTPLLEEVSEDEEVRAEIQDLVSPPQNPTAEEETATDEVHETLPVAQEEQINIASEAALQSTEEDDESLTPAQEIQNTVEAEVKDVSEEIADSINETVAPSLAPLVDTKTQDESQPEPTAENDKVSSEETLPDISQIPANNFKHSAKQAKSHLHDLLSKNKPSLPLLKRSTPEQTESDLTENVADIVETIEKLPQAQDSAPTEESQKTPHTEVSPESKRTPEEMSPDQVALPTPNNLKEKDLRAKEKKPNKLKSLKGLLKNTPPQPAQKNNILENTKDVDAITAFNEPEVKEEQPPLIEEPPLSTLKAPLPEKTLPVEDEEEDYVSFDQFVGMR